MSPMIQRIVPSAVYFAAQKGNNRETIFLRSAMASGSYQSTLLNKRCQTPARREQTAGGGNEVSEMIGSLHGWLVEREQRTRQSVSFQELLRDDGLL